MITMSSIFGYDRGAGLSLAQAKSLASYQNGKFGSFFIRYLAGPESWKYFSKTEVENLKKAGFMIGSVFQEGKDGPKYGYSAGKVAANKAKQRAIALGQPKKSAIFFAVDYDAPKSDYNQFEAFLKGAQEILGDDYFAGVYGKFDVIEEMAKRGACKYFWQTYAWSKGKLSKYADLYQYKNDTMVNGINVDLNECFNPEIFWGQYKEEVEQPEPPVVIEPVKTLEMFDDVPENHWAAESIKKAYNKGIMSGIGDKKFGLIMEVKREEVVVVIDRLGLMNDKPIIREDFPFKDVPDNHWAINSIKKAYTTGTINGISSEKFGLGDTLTREQFVKILENLGLITVDDFWEVPDIYEDVPSDHWAAEAIKDSYLKGAVIGVAKYKFGLGEAVMREQVAKVFDNMKMLD